MLGPGRSFARAPIEMAAPGLDLCARPEPEPGLGGADSKGRAGGPSHGRSGGAAHHGQKSRTSKLRPATSNCGVGSSPHSQMEEDRRISLDGESLWPRLTRIIFQLVIL